MSALQSDHSQQLLRLRAAGSPEIDASMSLPDLARATCRQWLATLIEYAPATRRGDDIEALHEMRVAARRLEAAIELFKDHLPAWAFESRAALRSITRALGATRDLDVQLEFVHRCMAEASADERPLLEPLESRLQAHRTRAQIRMQEVLDAPGTEEWLAHWFEFLTAGHEPSRAPEESVADFALAAIRRRYKRVRKAAERLSTASRAEQLHEVRSRVKRLRYALDTFAPICGKACVEFLRALVRLQDVLGEYQDAHVRTARLAALAESRGRPLPAATLLFMGRIMERDLRTGHKARRRVPKAYRRIRGRRWKALRRSLRASHGCKRSATQSEAALIDTAPTHEFSLSSRRAVAESGRAALAAEPART
jgi:CHAD domain-containing protein